MRFSFCIDIFSKNDQKKKNYKAVKSRVFPSVLILLVKMIKRKNVTPIKRTRASSYIKRRLSGEF